MRWKILHSESSLGWGGQERRILLEMEAMRKRGCEVHLASPPGSMILSKASQRGYPVHPVEMKRWFHPSTLASVCRLLRKESFDLVHTHSSSDSWALGVAAKFLGRRRPRVVRTRHLSTPVRGALVYTRLTDGIITTGQAIRRHLIEKGVDPAKVVSIPTGVDLEIFRICDASREKFRQEIGADPQTAVIGNVAVLRSWKGHDDFLEAAKRVRKAWPASKFVIAGDGPQSERLKDRVANEGLSDFVRLLGHREDIPAVLAGLDVFLFTSYANEGVPQAVAQAMAMAKPVVATRAGSIEDLITDGITGLLVQPRDCQSMAEALIKLLKDPGLAGRLGEAAQGQVYWRFSLAKMEEDLCEAYYRVFGTNSNARQGPSLRIALIRQKVSPRGGAEGVVYRLAHELACRGHQVHVLAASWEEPLPNVTYHRIVLRKTVTWLSALAFQRGAAKILREQRFDVVHGFDKTYPVDVYRAGDGSHRAWMDHAVKGAPAWKKILLWLDPKNWVILRLEKKLLGQTSLKKVIANSQMVRRELIQYHELDPRKVIVIQNGIDGARCDPPASREGRRQARRSMGLDGEGPVLLFIGTNYHRKGLIHALEAVARHQEKAITLLVAGKGREKAYREFCRRRGIENRVRFLGKVEDTRPLYQASDLFILPTLYDPFSNVCLEAMAHGVPVLTTPANGASEVVAEGKTGWIAPPENFPQALDTALKSDLWAMGRAALEQSRQHTFSRMTDEIAKVYLSLSFKGH